MSGERFEEVDVDKKGKTKRNLAVVIGVLIVVGIIIYIFSNSANLLDGGTTKYKLTERTQIQATGYGMFYATTDSYVQLKNVTKEDGYIKSGTMLIHLVFDDGSWREYEEMFFLQNNTSNGQYYSAPYDSPWTQFKIINGAISFLYTSSSGFTYIDLTFKK